MKIYILLLVFILIVLDEKRQVTGNRLCEKLCRKKPNMQCYKNSICWQTVKRCIRRRKCPPTVKWKHFDTVKIIPIELRALNRQRNEHVKINYNFPIFKLKALVFKG